MLLSLHGLCHLRKTCWRSHLATSKWIRCCLYRIHLFVANDCKQLSLSLGTLWRQSIMDHLEEFLRSFLISNTSRAKERNWMTVPSIDEVGRWTRQPPRSESLGGHGWQLVLLVLISLRISRRRKYNYNALPAFNVLPHALFRRTRKAWWTDRIF